MDYRKCGSVLIWILGIMYFVFPIFKLGATSPPSLNHHFLAGLRIGKAGHNEGGTFFRVFRNPHIAYISVPYSSQRFILNECLNVNNRFMRRNLSCPLRLVHVSESTRV